MGFRGIILARISSFFFNYLLFPMLRFFPFLYFSFLPFFRFGIEIPFTSSQPTLLQNSNSWSDRGGSTGAKPRGVIQSSPNSWGEVDVTPETSWLPMDLMVSSDTRLDGLSSLMKDQISRMMWAVTTKSCRNRPHHHRSD